MIRNRSKATLAVNRFLLYIPCTRPIPGITKKKKKNATKITHLPPCKRCTFGQRVPPEFIHLLEKNYFNFISSAFMDLLFKLKGFCFWVFVSIIWKKNHMTQKKYQNIWPISKQNLLDSFWFFVVFFFIVSVFCSLFDKKYFDGLFRRKHKITWAKAKWGIKLGQKKNANIWKALEI